MSEQPFAVQAALRRHFERESHSGRGVVLRQLLRSDVGRLDFFDGSRVIDHFEIQRRYVVGDSERICVEAAQGDADLAPVLGYALTDDQSRPQEFAWLLRHSDGAVIDPARGRYGFLAGLGVALRPGEVARWLPGRPEQVAVTDVSRLAVR